MPDFQPQTGQIILQAAQAIISTENQRRQLELEEERQKRIADQAKAEMASKEREVAARERFASIQESQLKFQEEASAATAKLREAQAREATASAALKEIQAAGGGSETALPEITAGERMNIAKEAARVSASQALAASGNAAVQAYSGAPRDTIEADIRQAQREREGIFGNQALSLPTNADVRNKQLEEIKQREDAAREALRLYDTASTALPTPQVMAEVSAKFGLSTITSDMLMAQQDRFPVMHRKYFGSFPLPTVRRALSVAASGDTGPWGAMLDRTLLRDDGTVDNDGLKEVLEFMNGFGVRKDILDSVKQRYVGR